MTNTRPERVNADRPRVITEEVWHAWHGDTPLRRERDQPAMTETMGQAFERAKRERDIAQAQVAAVTSLHFTAPPKHDRCEECDRPWPCITIRAIDAAGAGRKMAFGAADGQR